MDQLDATQAKSLTMEIDGQVTDIFLVRNIEGVFGYIDRCPHAGSPLEWKADHFLDEEFEYIICASHGAQFRIESGYCFSGPCKKQSLSGLNVLVEDGQVFYLGKP